MLLLCCVPDFFSIYLFIRSLELWIYYIYMIWKYQTELHMSHHVSWWFKEKRIMFVKRQRLKVSLQRIDHIANSWRSNIMITRSAWKIDLKRNKDKFWVIYVRNRNLLSGFKSTSYPCKIRLLLVFLKNILINWNGIVFLTYT